MNARLSYIRDTLVRGGMTVHEAKAWAQEIEARQPLDPRTNPTAWDEKRDQFVAAALQSSLMTSNHKVDGKPATHEEFAIACANNMMLLIYGHRPEVEE